MVKDEMVSGAEHVLTNGTARTRAKAAETDGKPGAGKEPEGGDGAASGAKKIASIEISPDTKGGGRHIRHKHHPPHQKPEHDETYSVGDQAAMHEHLDQHMAEPGETDEESGAPTTESQTQTDAMPVEEMPEHGGESGAA